MEKWFILVGILLSILMGSLLILSSETDKNPYTHSYTKAICNSENYCQDYEIFCKNRNIVSISPITGASIQLPENWEDPRSAEVKNKLC